jgi:hypothetical protein
LRVPFAADDPTLVNQEIAHKKNSCYKLKQTAITTE